MSISVCNSIIKFGKRKSLVILLASQLVEGVALFDDVGSRHPQLLSHLQREIIHGTHP